jgi:lysine-specific demethylase/histidyl-hydroxylase NO66
VTTPTRPTPTSVPQTPRANLAGGALARSIEPVPAEEFAAEHWERRPLLVERAGRGRFDDLLSEADVERLVCTSGIRHPAFRLVKAGETISLADYTVDIAWRPTAFSKTADPERVATAFADGATIVVQGLHHWWEPLARFCRDLERELGHPAQANAYYTPRDSQGLPVHHDTHDVFVLQVAGEKRWLVYEPVWELPLKDQRYKPEMGEPGPAVLDVTLRAGDTLYLPRGWLHEALTSETDSLHLTVGVSVYTWLDALGAALASCADDVRFRRSVPSDGAGRDELLDTLSARLEPASVARRMRRRFVSTRRPVLDGQLSQLRALAALTVETPVERRATVIADVGSEDGSVTLAFEGKTVVFPARVGAAVEHAATAERAFRARDVPGDLDEAGRLVFVRRLVREGFLRLTDARSDGPSPRGDGAAPA